MKRKQIISIIIIALSSFFVLTSNSGGKMGVSSTGCGGSGCHGTSASAASQVFLLFDGVSNLTKYTPGKKYSVTLSLTNTDFASNSNAKVGFDLLVSSGTISNVPANTMLMTKELHHTSPITLFTGAANIKFDWTAPSTGGGNVSFSVAANIVNGDGSTSGDAWNKTSVSLTEETATTTKPTISSQKSQSVTSSSAIISGNVNANGSSTTVEVQYGLSTTYGLSKSMSPASVTGSTVTSTTATLTGLNPNTTYHYRIRATNSAGETLYSDSTFKTTAAASISNSQENVLSAYPNPASSKIYVESPNDIDLDNLSLYDNTGKKLNLSILSEKKGKIEISIEGLSEGIYYLRENDRSGYKVPIRIVK